MIRETHHLPTDGLIALVPGAESTYRDPLSGEPVVHVPPGEAAPDGASQTWLPLEFVMRFVEDFVRRHIAEIVTVWDAIRLDENLSMVDPAALVKSLEEVRGRFASKLATREVTR